MKAKIKKFLKVQLLDRLIAAVEWAKIYIGDPRISDFILRNRKKRK